MIKRRLIVVICYDNKEVSYCNADCHYGCSLTCALLLPQVRRMSTRRGTFLELLQVCWVGVPHAPGTRGLAVVPPAHGASCPPLAGSRTVPYRLLLLLLLGVPRLRHVECCAYRVVYVPVAWAAASQGYVLCTCALHCDTSGKHTCTHADRYIRTHIKCNIAL